MSIHTHWIGSLRGDAEILRSDEPFVLAGVEWAAPAQARIELRARTTTGRWSAWTPAAIQGHDADLGEAVAHARFGEPVWTGPSREIQLRSAGRVDGLSLHLVPAAMVMPTARRARSVGASPQAAPSATTADGLPLAAPLLPAGPGQPPIIARRAWAGDRGPAVAPSYGDVRMMFVHHSVNANGYSAAQVPEMLLSIYEFHRYVRGWNDIGYNFAIDAFGRVWEARQGGIDQAVVGAQAGGYNLESAGVVMLGTFAAVLPTAAALATLQRLLAWKLSLHGVPVSGHTTLEVDPADAFYTRYRGGTRVRLPRIAGHRDGCTTDCPGEDLYLHLPVVRANVARAVGRQVGLSLGFDMGQDVVAAEYLQLASTTLAAGDLVNLAGRLAELTPAGQLGRAVSGETVQIQVLEGETESELVVDDLWPPALVTDSAGQFSAAFTPARNMLVRALKPGAPAVASPLLAIGVAPVLTLTVAGRSPLTLTGTVTPVKAKLQLLVHHVGGMQTLVHHETFTPRADGSFTVRPKLAAGRYRIRVESTADGANVAAQSPGLSVTV